MSNANRNQKSKNFSTRTAAADLQAKRAENNTIFNKIVKEKPIKNAKLNVTA